MVALNNADYLRSLMTSNQQQSTAKASSSSSSSSSGSSSNRGSSTTINPGDNNATRARKIAAAQAKAKKISGKTSSNNAVPQSFDPAMNFFNNLQSSNSINMGAAGTSSREFGYVDSSGRTIATPNEIHNAVTNNQLVALQNKARAKEAQIKAKQQAAIISNKQLQQAMAVQNKMASQVGPRIQQNSQSFINSMSIIDTKGAKDRMNIVANRNNAINEKQRQAIASSVVSSYIQKNQ